MQSPSKRNDAHEMQETVASWLDSTQAKWLGAAGAVGVTLATARDAIGRAYFKSMNKKGADAFTDLQRERDEQIGKIVAPAKQGKELPDAMDRIKLVNQEYDVKLCNRQKALGVHSVFDEAKALKRHQWMEVVMSTGAVAAVALGAVLAIASNRDIAQKQREMEETNGKNAGPSV